MFGLVDKPANPYMSNVYMWMCVYDSVVAGPASDTMSTDDV